MFLAAVFWGQSNCTTGHLFPSGVAGEAQAAHWGECGWGCFNQHLRKVLTRLRICFFWGEVFWKNPMFLRSVWVERFPVGDSVVFSNYFFFVNFRFHPCGWNQNHEMKYLLNQPFQEEQLFSHMLHGTGIFSCIYHKFKPNVGKYSSPMEHLGILMKLGPQKMNVPTIFGWFVFAWLIFSSVLGELFLESKNFTHRSRAPLGSVTENFRESRELVNHEPKTGYYQGSWMNKHLGGGIKQYKFMVNLKDFTFVNNPRCSMLGVFA